MEVGNRRPFYPVLRGSAATCAWLSTAQGRKDDRHHHGPTSSLHGPFATLEGEISSTIVISDQLDCCHIAASSRRATGDALQVAGVAATTACPTTLESFQAARSGGLQLERGADRTDWLAFEAWNGASEPLAQGAE
jgi:hypothetical protein